MSLEIERKFMVSELPPVARKHTPNTIEQGYIVTAKEQEFRIRSVNSECFLTVKKGSGLVRTEVEISITHEQYAQLWPLTEGKRLRKLRYIIPYQKHKIELDVYEEPLKGLLIAEVEFADTASSENFQAPEWFGREVTGIAEYSNFYLATEGRYFE